MQNFLYMIADEKTKQALIVDPAWAPDTIVSLPEKAGYKLKGLLVTHAHYDHTNAIEEILSKLDIPVYANKNEVPYAQSGSQIVGKLGSTLKPTENEEVLKLGETEVKFLHTPGHTPGSQCIIVGNALITGDTLFIDGCGRSDLPGGDARTLFKSLRKIATLPADLQILPGHDYGPVPQRSLREEIAHNTYLKMINEDQFINAVS